jgi:hypothetical protein
MTFSGLWAALFDLDEKDITIPAGMAGQKYFLMFKQAKNTPADLQKIGEQILGIAGLSKKQVPRKVPIWVCTLKDDKLLDKSAEEWFSSYSEAGDKMIFTGFTLPNLMKALNKYTTQRLAFSGNHPGSFDFIIDIKTPEDILTSLKTYGIDATTEERTVNTIVFEAK